MDKTDMHMYMYRIRKVKWPYTKRVKGCLLQIRTTFSLTSTALHAPLCLLPCNTAPENLILIMSRGWSAKEERRPPAKPPSKCSYLMPSIDGKFVVVRKEWLRPMRLRLSYSTRLDWVYIKSLLHVQVGNPRYCSNTRRNHAEDDGQPRDQPIVIMQ